MIDKKQMYSYFDQDYQQQHRMDDQYMQQPLDRSMQRRMDDSYVYDRSMQRRDDSYVQQPLNVQYQAPIERVDVQSRANTFPWIFYLPIVNTIIIAILLVLILILVFRRR